MPTATRAAALACAGALALIGAGSCQVAPLATAVGRNIVIHWDPDEYRLCGGTLEYVDRSLEVIAAHYGVGLPERPSVDMVLSPDLGLALALCRLEAGGCTATYPNGTALMVLTRPVHPHELTHAIRLTGSRDIMPRLFREGLAVRWEPGPAQLAGDRPNYVGELDYAALRGQLADNQDPPHYLDAGFLWAWLEAEHGPAAMAEFASRLSRFASAETIEREFAEVFGRSLEDATVASRGAPLYMFDVHACAMLELPTLRWTDAPLPLSGEPGDCGDADVVDIRGRGVRLRRLELPNPASDYILTVDGGPDTEVRFDACLGTARPYQNPRSYEPRTQGTVVELGGTYIVSSFGPIGEDGRVEFPRVELRANAGWP